MIKNIRIDIIILGILVFVGLYSASLISYLFFHIIAELINISIGFSVFVLAWNSRKYQNNGYLLFIGFVSLFVSAIVVAHTMTFKGMNIIPGYDTNTPTQLWIGSRYIQSLAFLVAPLFLKRQVKIRPTLIGLSVIFIGFMLSVFVWRNFPAAYIEGVGLTPFKISSEYIIIAIFCGAILMLYRYRQFFDRQVYRLLVGTLVTSIFADLAFTTYFNVYSLANLIGHYFLIASAYLLNKSIIQTGIEKPFALLFRDLKQHEEELQAAQARLENLVDERTAELRREVEEHRAAEIALEEHQILLESILKQAADAIVVCDAAGEITFANAAARKIAAIPEGQPIQMNEAFWGEAHDLNGDILPLTEWSSWEALAGKTTTGRELHLVHADGSAYDILMSAAPLMNHEGTLVGSVTVFADISARKRAEEELRKTNQELETRVLQRTSELQQINRMLAQELLDRQKAEEALQISEARLRRLVEANIIGVVDSASDGKISDANQAFLDLIGYSRAEMESGQINWKDITPQEFLELDRIALEEAHRRGACSPYEKEYIHKNGSRVAAMIGFAQKEEGADEYICFVLDLRELKQTQEALALYTSKLESSNRELQNFAFVASHDLQEPLRKIEAFGDRLRQRISGRLDQDDQDYLDRMLNATTRMRKMIDDLLTLSRVTTQAQPFCPVDLNQIAADVISDLDVRINQSTGKVELQPLPIIEADPMQMHQLFQNLIGNALKFHKANVPPQVKVYSSLMNSDHDNEAVQIRVEDNGIGFEEDQLERIFQPFTRLNGRNQYEGSGIGLAICAKIIERHRGNITARSEPGKGSTFIATIPLQHQNP